MSEGPQINASNPDLFEYLQRTLLGSSLTVVKIGANEISIESGETISMKIVSNPKKKLVDFSIFSKTLNRSITVEEINGSTFMEARMEEELEKEDRMIMEEDILISVDLLRLWAKENGYALANEGLTEKPRASKSTK
ncbi:MAG TPA: hypothetical protein VED17_03440 [Nitrososphaerales archaeon]|nr:hypothetical protein [Nitrososphaerales archaeon]